VSAVEAERLARCGLLGVSEPGDLAVADFVAAVGPVRAWEALSTGRALPDDLRRCHDRAASADPATVLASGTEAGLRLIVPGDLEWPSQLGDLRLGPAGRLRGSAPPFALWVRGAENLRLAVLRSAAVVGSRASTPYGNRVAAELGAGLAELGCSTVSGGAYGIDSAAHRGAMAVGGLTVAVLACGADVAYPSGHTALLERVAAEGVVVSELPPGSHPTRARFLERNRLIAALTRGTVVVEAAVRSGALSTAAWARRMNRPVLGVPGPVTSAMSAGVHRELIARRAELVTSASDVLSVLDPLTGSAAEPSSRLAVPDVPEGEDRDRLDDETSRVLAAVPVRRPVSVARLAEATGSSTEAVEVSLEVLRLTGLVEQRADGWRLVGAVDPRRGPARWGDRNERAIGVTRGGA
jgi:DNA processing protein